MDSVSKEAAWMPFAKFSNVPMIGHQRQQSFLSFGKVFFNRRRKRIVGIRFKESTKTENKKDRDGTRGSATLEL